MGKYNSVFILHNSFSHLPRKSPKKCKFYIVNQENQNFLAVIVKIHFNIRIIFFHENSFYLLYVHVNTSILFSIMSWSQFFFFFLLALRLFWQELAFIYIHRIYTVFLLRRFTCRHFLESSTNQILLQKQFSTNCRQNWCS